MFGTDELPVKLVVAIDDEDWKEDQIKALLRRMRTLVDTVSNPFHEPDSELYKCANFVRQVERIVEANCTDLFIKNHASAHLLLFLLVSNTLSAACLLVSTRTSSSSSSSHAQHKTFPYSRSFRLRCLIASTPGSSSRGPPARRRPTPRCRRPC